MGTSIIGIESQFEHNNSLFGQNPNQMHRGLGFCGSEFQVPLTEFGGSLDSQDSHLKTKLELHWFRQVFADSNLSGCSVDDIANFSQ